MSSCRRRGSSTALPGRPYGLKPAAGQKRGSDVLAGKPDRKAGREQVKDHALSRFGLDVGKIARQALVLRVQKGDVKYARKLTNSRTVIVLDHAGGEIAFLYSNATKDIVSFLAPDAGDCWLAAIAGVIRARAE
jgi:hypothetical protein